MKKKLSISILYIFSLSSIFISPALSEENSYVPSLADKYGSSHGSFESVWVNETVQKLPDAEVLIKGPDYYEASNFDFSCPGHSIMIGVSSEYKAYNSEVDTRKHNADRKFKFKCAFLEDDKNRLIRKSNCDKQVSSKTDYADYYDNKSAENGSSKCSEDTQFISGITSKRFRGDYESAVDKEFKDDRLNLSKCCELNDADGNSIKSTDKCTEQTFAAGANIDLECGSDEILKKIRSSYFSDKWDRSYIFQCCKTSS